jgi:hypothetical protein
MIREILLVNFSHITDYNPYVETACSALGGLQSSWRPRVWFSLLEELLFNDTSNLSYGGHDTGW